MSLNSTTVIDTGHRYNEVGTTKFDFKPKYVALAAFRGLIEGSETHAFFNKVIIEECN